MRGRCTEPGGRRSLTAPSIDERPGFAQRNPQQIRGLRCGHAKSTSAGSAGRSRRQPGRPASLMLATEPRMAIGWDEGYTLGREARLRDWFRGLRDPVGFAAQWRPLPRELELVQEADKTPAPARHQLDSRSKLLSDPEVLAWFWPFAREEPHGHPPFYALLGLAGRRPGPVLARSAACPSGADPAL